MIYLVCFMTAKRLRLQYEKEPSADDETKAAEDKRDEMSPLPTAADREKRQVTTAERLAELNRQAQDVREPEEQSSSAGKEDD